MISSTVALGLLGLAAASPLSMRQTPSYPPTSVSRGFKLVVNVTDPETDFQPSIQNMLVEGLHVGAGLNDAGIQAAGQIFYQNGTLAGGSANGNPQNVRFLSDEGEPLSPYGLGLAEQSTGEVNQVTINGGEGSAGFGVTTFPTTYAYVTPDNFLACNTSLEYYEGEYFITLQQYIGTGTPENCTHIRLVPQCAKLEALPSGSYSSHANALETDCYKDVASINWPQYGP